MEPMNKPAPSAHPDLALGHIRNVLTRLEETIIFGIIERAQFLQNAIIYQPRGVGPQLGDESLLGFLLHECECSHAKVRRYTSPDEYPFYDGLPAPVLPGLQYDNPLRPNRVNLNPEIRHAYETEMIPFFCAPGDDRQWGSSAVNDVYLLQALSKRIHYGKFVAEGKCRARPDVFGECIRRGDAEGLRALITEEAVERRVLERVFHKATVYGQEFESGTGHSKVDPETVRALYARWIIPLNKKVQVLYLLERDRASAAGAAS